MDPARETAKERGGGHVSVSNVLLVSDAGGITLWGGDLGFVGGNFPEAVGISRVISQIDWGAEDKSEEGWDLEKQGSGECAQGSGNPDTGGVYWQATGNSSVVGGV